ncbi:hypothetical protein ASPBRDRAFT_457098 [Aspergillus brasiliensis CBS 101740]|uniref:Uncharacterized protein n=1 Tax=Aspergillus brasiliensis (strain CBS 101740 / IMI 381727 / IBT 21946) TaxID=767769 RepID=A0A1L9USQ3_ASPBC|nr:hypothetical protein ASPBRDRAFT_457098 [Aspergillus brasiliensis CBS 101740]
MSGRGRSPVGVGNLKHGRYALAQAWPKVTENIGPGDGHGLMHECTMLQLPSLAMFEQMPPNLLEVTTRSMSEDVGCQMLIPGKSLVGTIRLPSKRVPYARPPSIVRSPGDY